MDFQGAVVKEQGVTFGILVVEPSVLHDRRRQEQLRAFGRRAFGAIPVVLMAQDSRRVPTYQGRPDIVKFLANVSIERIPWKKYSLSI